MQQIEQTIVALFVRRPLAGRVKTRLARELGAVAACELYCAMVADVIAAVKGSGLPLYLFHDGAEDDLLPVEWCRDTAGILAQEGNSLGQRMERAFRRSFAAGAGGVILTGSDIPGIDGALLRSARQSIQRHATAFAPALDGGYCLVAAGKDSFNGIIFRDIPWSTARVLDLTLAACAAHDLSYCLLESRRDIDTLDDLRAYCRHPSPAAPATNAWLASQGLLSSHR